MQWQMATLAYERFGGPDAIREQLTTEQYPQLPCGEFHTRRLSHPDVPYLKPLIGTVERHLAFKLRLLELIEQLSVMDNFGEPEIR